jgi:thiosulfate/3-mercaptopyruvate sulfurtransferase
MKSTRLLTLLCSLLFSQFIYSQPNSFKAEQLLQPSKLNEAYSKPASAQPLILNMGVERNIKNAIEVGIVSSPSKYQKLVEAMKKVPKNREIVVYCGCCKLENCPNIPIALEKLSALGFKNVKILNLIEGINEDWIDKKYPMNY